MGLAFSIARKYFLAGSKRNFINVIAIISMLTLAIATCALFIVLSVFNGLGNLITNVHNSFDADLEIQASNGKIILLDENLTNKILAIDGIASFEEVIEDDAFVNYNNQQKVVRVKGVSRNYLSKSRIAEYLKKGSLDLKNGKGRSFTVFGKGIEYGLNVSMADLIHPLQIWYPKRKKKVIKDQNSFNQVNVLPGGVFEIERQYDDLYMFIPLEEAQYLFDYENERTSLEIIISDGFKKGKVKDNLQEILGNEFNVISSEEKHASLYRAIKLEKLIAFVIFVFILAIAAINIFLTLSMIVLSKRKDIIVLRTMGATDKFIRSIFLLEGFLIGGIGSILGISLGILICYLQQEYGFYGLHIESAITDSFPVKMELADVFITVIITFSITLIIALKPAIDAPKVKLNEYL